MTEIRTGRPADLDALRDIQSNALAEPWPALLETAVQGSLPLFVIAEGNPLGYGIVLPGSDGVAYVPELAIDPERQGEGHGSTLLTAIVEFLVEKAYETVRVTVRVVDERAQEFYLNRGFERIERLDNHFESGDGLVLSRSLR